MDGSRSILAAGIGLVLIGLGAAEGIAADDVVVSVNGDTFTEAEMERILDQRMEVLSGRVPAEQMENYEAMFREQLAEEFVVKTLLGKEAQDQGFTPTEEEVEAFIEDTKSKLPPGLEFEQFLSIQGMDADNMREEFQTQLAIQRLMEAQADEGGEVSEEDMRSFYEQEKERLSTPETVRARHILIEVKPDASDQAKATARKKLEALREEVEQGGDFAALAEEHSDCPSGPRGGDLGQFGRGQMVKPFEEAAFSQQVGTVGDIVETRFGYHLIEVLEHTDAEDRSYEEVRDQIARHLQGNRRGEYMKNLVDELRSKADIEYPSD